jgi:hypothetical protein
MEKEAVKPTRVVIKRRTVYRIFRMTFSDARKWVRAAMKESGEFVETSKRTTRSAQVVWREWKSKHQLPKGLPASPHTVYSMKDGWDSYADWIGRKRARALNKVPTNTSAPVPPTLGLARTVLRSSEVRHTCVGVYRRSE